jgi:hypothetical protein
VRWYTIEQWLKEHYNGEVKPHLDYAQTIRIYHELFGKESVTVCLYEELNENTNYFIEKIAQFIGIDPKEAIGHTDGQWVNRRWTEQQLKTLKAINGSFLRSLAFRFTRNSQRRHLLGFTPEYTTDNSPPARAIIPEHWQQRVEDDTRSGNRWLVETYNLPLDRYNYPL